VLTYDRVAVRLPPEDEHVVAACLRGFPRSLGGEKVVEDGFTDFDVGYLYLVR
jgi:hypothetical protein